MSINGSLTKRKYVNVLLPLFIGSTLAFLDRLNISYAALTMNKDLGFNAKVFGMGAGILFLGYVLFEIPGSIFAANRSPSKWLVRIMITWGIACSCMTFIHTSGQFYFVRFLIGAAEASFYPVCYAVIMPRWFNANERPKAISIMLISLLTSNILGSPIAGLLINQTWMGFVGWQMLFLLEGAMAFIFGIILIFWLKDWPKDVKWMTEEEKKERMAEYEAEIDIKNAAKKYTIWQAMGDPTLIKLCLIYFLWISGFWGFGFWLPTVLKGVSGASNSSVSFLIMIPMLIASLVFYLNGKFAESSKTLKNYVAWPMFVGAFGMIAGTMTSNTIISFIFTIITCIGVYCGMGVWWAIPTTYLSGAAAAAGTAMINSIGNIGGWCGPYLVGFSKANTGSYHMAYLILAASLALSGILMLTLKQKVPNDISTQQSSQNITQ